MGRPRRWATASCSRRTPVPSGQTRPGSPGTTRRAGRVPRTSLDERRAHRGGGRPGQPVDDVMPGQAVGEQAAGRLVGRVVLIVTPQFLDPAAGPAPEPPAG